MGADATRAPRRRWRWVLAAALAAAGVALVLLLLTAGGAPPAQAGAEDADAPSALTHELAIPLDDGSLDLGDMLGDLFDLIGPGGQTLRDHINVRLDIRGTLGQVKLDAIERFTDGMVRFELDEDGLVMIVDRVRLRRSGTWLHGKLRQLVELWFPEQAALARAQHGLKLVDAAGRRTDAAAAVLPARVVVLVHGLDEPGRLWWTLIPHLGRAGYTVCELSYPNDQPILDSTEFLAKALETLKQRGVQRVSLVAHSMGGLLCREVLTNEKWYGGRGTGAAALPDIDRLIMIGTPNQGAPMAQLRFAVELRDQITRAFSGDGLLFGGFFDGAGEARVDLLPESTFLTALNARPHPEGVPLTIIAGSLSPVDRAKIGRFKTQLPADMGATIDQLAAGLEQLSEGVGDGVVSVESTRLPGVSDHVIVKGNHLTMIRSVFSQKHIPPAVPIVLERLGGSDAPGLAPPE